MQRGHLSILYKDQLQLDRVGEEFMKKYYPKEKYEKKVTGLLNYYLYHIDIPRVFMRPQCELIMYFQRGKRRLVYQKISLMVMKEQPRRIVPPETRPLPDTLLDKISQGSSITELRA